MSKWKGGKKKNKSREQKLVRKQRTQFIFKKEELKGEREKLEEIEVKCIEIKKQ